MCLILQVVTLMEPKEIPCQVCIRTIAKKPGVKDNNFQVWFFVAGQLCEKKEPCEWIRNMLHRLFLLWPKSCWTQKKCPFLQVLKLKADLIAHVAKNGKFSKQCAEFVLADMVDKAGDPKNGSAIQEGFSCMAENCGLEYISQKVVVLAFEQKNPKNQSEALNWLTNAVKEFGFKCVQDYRSPIFSVCPVFSALVSFSHTALRHDITLNLCQLLTMRLFCRVNVKPLIQYIKKAFAATNPVRTAQWQVTSHLVLCLFPWKKKSFTKQPNNSLGCLVSSQAVRTAAVGLLGVLYMYMGQTLRVLFEDEKAALLQQIDAEFEKVMKHSTFHECNKNFVEEFWKAPLQCATGMFTALLVHL